MEKAKIRLFKSVLISQKKPCKRIPLFLKDNNMTKRINILEKYDKDKSLDKSINSKFSKNITLSNSYIKSQLLMINSKRESNKKYNIKNNKKEYSKQQQINLGKKKVLKNIQKVNYNYITKKNSFSTIKSSINETNFNRTFSINKLFNKNNGSYFKTNNYSLKIFPKANIRNNNEVIINQKDSSFNYVKKRFKNKICSKNSKKKLININPLISIKKINAINALNDLNCSSKNINKIFININDFKKFNGEILKRKINEYKTNRNFRNLQNHNVLIKIYPSIQSSIRIPKKESFISNKSETNSLENKKIKNKSKESKIKNKEKKLSKKKYSKTLTNSRNNLINIIDHSQSIKQLNNRYNIGKYQINAFSNKYNIKTTKLYLNKKRNINHNIKDINNGNNTTKNLIHKSIKKLNNEIINIRIDNTINNIVNINNNLNSLNNIKYLTTNSKTIINKNKKKIVYNDKNDITKIKEKDLVQKKIKKNVKQKYFNPNKLCIKTEENRINNKKKKNKSLKSLSLRKRKNINKNNKLNHNFLYMNLIRKNHIKKLKNKKYNSKNRVNNGNINNSFILNQNIKKIREERKKRSNISITSINAMKINSNIKLQELKTIFYNFYNIEKNQLLSCKTPKTKFPSTYKSLNYLNITQRFNKTEEIINNFNKSPKKNEENNTKTKIYDKIKNNPQYLNEYVDEILQNLLIEENEHFETINFDSFNINNSSRYRINPESWKFFINSLINIQEVLYFNEHTLFSTIHIFDQYISEILNKEQKEAINEANLDIVIVISLIIASKKEEIKLYPMKDYLNLLPNKYSIKDLIGQENDILSKFNFNLFTPNILDFFELFSIICKLDNLQRSKGLYLLNIIVLDCYLLKIPPSQLAFCVIKIICKNNLKKYLVSKISSRYIKENINKEVKILKIINKNNIINNIIQYIQSFEKNIQLSNYDSAIKKFNNKKYHYAPSYRNIQ